MKLIKQSLCINNYVIILTLFRQGLNKYILRNKDQ